MPISLGQRIAGEQVSVVPDDLDRLVELRACGDHARRAGVGDRQLAQLLPVLDESLVQLIKAPGAEGHVRRPARGVERSPGGGDGGPRVRDSRVGGVANHLPSRRVHRRVRAVRRDQLPVDEHAVLHPLPPFRRKLHSLSPAIKLST